MTCDEFNQQLIRSIESRTNLPAPAQQHAEHCPHPDCRTAWQDYLLLNRHLAHWRAREFKLDDCSSAVLEKLNLAGQAVSMPPVEQSSKTISPDLPGPLPHNLRSPSPWGIGLPIATLVAMVLVSFLTTISSNKQLVESRIQRPPSAWNFGEDPLPVELAANLSEEERAKLAVRDLGNRWVNWMGTASERITDQVSFVVTPVEMPGEMPRTGTTEWLRKWGEQLKMIETEVNTTLDHLLQPLSQTIEERTS